MEINSVIGEVCAASEGDAKGISCVIGKIRAASAGDAKEINCIREEVRADTAGINRVRREAREGRVEACPTTPKTNSIGFQAIKSSSSFCPSPW
jgi:hypothetical protein